MRLSIRWGSAVLFLTMLAGPVPATEAPRVQKAWDVLDAGVKEKSSSKRHDAVLALGLVQGEPRAITLAEAAAEDHAPEVREAAAATLGKLNSPGSVPKLQAMLNDPEISVVLAAAHSLLTFHDKRGYDVYYEILSGERKSGKGLIASQEAMLKDKKKLAEIGIEEGMGFSPFTSMGFEVFKMVHKDDVSPVRAAAARILAHDPDPRSGQELVLSCSDKSWLVRVAALDALSRRGDRTVLDDIEPHMDDEKDVVRYTAAAAILRLSAAQSHQRLHSQEDPGW